MATTRHMHSWVNELMDTWLKEVYDPELLDDWTYQIELRKQQLGVIADDELIEKLKRGLKDTKRNATIWTMTSLKAHYRPSKADAGHQERLEGKPDEFWHKARFHSYQPRNVNLWLIVPWPTGHKYGRGTWALNLERDGSILKYQPSRTECAVRQRVAAAKLRRPR